MKDEEVTRHGRFHVLAVDFSGLFFFSEVHRGGGGFDLWVGVTELLLAAWFT